MCINRTRVDVISVQGVNQGSRFSLKRWALNDVDLLCPGQRILFIVMHFHILSADHLTSDGTDVFQGMHECVLVACPGDDNATEKSESRTRSLIHPTIPFAYLPPVVLTISGAPPVKNITKNCSFFQKNMKKVDQMEIICEYIYVTIVYLFSMLFSIFITSFGVNFIETKGKFSFLQMRFSFMLLK